MKNQGKKRNTKLVLKYKNISNVQNMESFVQK